MRWPGRKSRPFRFGLSRKNWRGPGGVFRRAPFMHQPTCKPGSVGRDTCVPRVTAIPLGRRLPGASSNLPGRLDPDRSRGCPRAVPIRSCSRWGLPCRRRCRRRGALLPHLFTLAATIRNVPRRFVLCGTVPEASPREGIDPAGRYPAPLIRGARTFLPGDLSVLAGAAVQPTDGDRNGGATGQRQGRDMPLLNGLRSANNARQFA